MPTLFERNEPRALLWDEDEPEATAVLALCEIPDGV